MKITIKELKNLIKEAVAANKDDIIITKLILDLETFDDEMTNPINTGKNNKDLWTWLKLYYINWNTDDKSMLYNERGFIRSFRQTLMNLGFSQKALRGIDYTDQGEQNDVYVSIGVNGLFVQEWKNLIGENEDTIEL